MGTISNKLTYLNDTKDAIKEAISLKGVTILDSDTFRSYANKISLISGGGITPSGTINITTNSNNINVTNYANANVNVKYKPRNRIMFEDNLEVDLTYETSNLDTSLLTDMSYMFLSCDNIETLDLSNWDTSNVTNMSNMFATCPRLRSVTFGNWDTSNVTNMSGMFGYSGTNIPYITSLDLSSFTSESLQTVYGMFFNLTGLLHLDIRGFELSTIQNLNYSDFLGRSSVGNVPTNCEIIVKNNNEKTWFNTNFPAYTNVLTVAEYENI